MQELKTIDAETLINNPLNEVEYVIEDILPNDYIKINFTKDEENENYRVLELIANGDNSRNILDNLN